jgi:hypothetical protein
VLEPQSDRSNDEDALQHLAASVAGYAVRVDWGNGSHDVMLFSPSLARVQRRMGRARERWRRSPVRPVAWNVIVTDRISYRVHGGSCTDPGCVLAGLGVPGGGR